MNQPSVALPSPLDRPGAEPSTSPERIAAVDTARGVALLGIFFVNAETMGQPFMSVWMDGRAPHNEGALSVAIYWFTVIFCTGKFYPLFSILFGFGVAVMLASAERSGRRFGWLLFRRLAILALFGLCHVVLLWAGDILLIYAMIGMWMLLFARCTAKALLGIAALVYGVGLASVAGLGLLLLMLGIGSGPEPAAVAMEMPPGQSPVHQYFLVLQDLGEAGLSDGRLIELERQIKTQGPFWAAAAIRLFHYLIVIFVLVFTLWIILPCFCLGAALLKLGFFHGQLPQWHRRMIWLGLIVGFPLSVLAAIAAQYPERPSTMLIAMLGMGVGGPLMSLMYLALIMQWVQSGAARPVAAAMASMGRMALTCYLMQSLLMSAVMMHWGGARFGDNTWAERAGWVLVIHLAILVFANFWMSRFRVGPLEWVWRALTYLQRPPLRKRPQSHGAPSG